MIDWQVTATTIYCDAVNDDVTLIVNRDWNVRCTGFTKYSSNLDKETVRMLHQKSRQSGRNVRCEGPQDFRVTDYRDILRARDKA